MNDEQKQKRKFVDFANRMLAFLLFFLGKSRIRKATLIKWDGESVGAFFKTLTETMSVSKALYAAWKQGATVEDLERQKLDRTENFIFDIMKTPDASVSECPTLQTATFLPYIEFSAGRVKDLTNEQTDFISEKIEINIHQAEPDHILNVVYRIRVIGQATFLHFQPHDRNRFYEQIWEDPTREIKIRGLH